MNNKIILLYLNHGGPAGGGPGVHDKTPSKFYLNNVFISFMCKFKIPKQTSTKPFELVCLTLLVWIGGVF